MGIRYCHPSQTERLITAGRVTTISLPPFGRISYLRPVEHVMHTWLINSLLIRYLVYTTVSIPFFVMLNFALVQRIFYYAFFRCAKMTQGLAC